MHGVEAQPVEAVLHQPVECVLDEVVAHLRPAEVDRRAPGRLHVVAEEAVCVGVQIVPVRAEMVVHDVEHHHQPEPVRGVDQRLQLVRRAVRGIRRVRQHAVIAPVVPPRKIGDRHEFDRRDAELLERLEPGRDAGEAAHRARVQLVDHRLVPGSAVPFAVPPLIGARVEHDARIVDVAGLQARGGVGHREIGLHPVAVACPRAARGGRAHPAARLALHRDRRLALDLERHRGRVRRPEPEPRGAVVLELGAEREPVAEDAPLHWAGLSTTVASGGKVSTSDAGWPWLSVSSARTPPPLPIFEPP